MVTSAGLVAPVVQAGHYSEAMVACVVLATACGATVLSQINGLGFWLVKHYMGLSEKQTLASWTLLEPVIGVVGLAILLAMNAFV